MSKMLIKDGLKFQIEITPTCNAMCRGCDRFIPGTDRVNPLLPQGKNAHMKWEFFKKIFSEKEIREKAQYIVFSGAYGDCTMHPEVKKFVRYVLEFCEVWMETNAGLHSPEWWEDLADPNIRIEFAIDGLDNETHTRYRRGVVWEKVMANAKAFIKGGGRAVWAMIEHDHNSHQIEDARKMAEELGFEKFMLKRSRITNYVKFDGSVKKKYEKADMYKTKSKRIPLKNVDVEFSEQEIDKVKKIAQDLNFASQEEYDNFTEIDCRWGNNNKFNIDHDGTVTRCCYFSAMYFQSPNEGNVDKGKIYNDIMKNREQGGYQYYIDKYGARFNSLQYHSLSEIITHQFFTKDLLESFNNPGGISENPRITNRCPNYCGEIQNNYRKARYTNDG